MKNLIKLWKWLDGKKTVLAGLGFILFGLTGLCLKLLETDVALQHVLTGATILGLGGKAQKLIDALKKLKR